MIHMTQKELRKLLRQRLAFWSKRACRYYTKEGYIIILDD